MTLVTTCLYVSSCFWR